MEGWKKWYIWIVAVFLLTAVVGKLWRGYRMWGSQV